MGTVQQTLQPQRPQLKLQQHHPQPKLQPKEVGGRLPHRPPQDLTTKLELAVTANISRLWKSAWQRPFNWALHLTISSHLTSGNHVGVGQLLMKTMVKLDLLWLHSIQMRI